MKPRRSCLFSAILLMGCNQTDFAGVVVLVDGLSADVNAIVAQLSLDGRPARQHAEFQGELSRLGFELPEEAAGTLAVELDAIDQERCVVARGRNEIQVTAPQRYEMNVLLGRLAARECTPQPIITCESEAQCSGPAAGMACDHKAGRCVPCSRHSDCESMVCDPYLTVKDPMNGADLPGRCLSQGEVLYVDNRNGGACTSGDGRSPAAAKCTMSEVLDLLSSVNKAAIRMMASTASYGPVAFPNNRTVTLYGPAGDGGKAQIGGNRMMDAVYLSVSDDITLNGVTVSAGLRGIECNSIYSRVGLRRVDLGDCEEFGAVITDCGLEIDRSRISGNKGGAITLTRVKNYAITNSFFSSNKSSQAMLIVDGQSTGVFRFNTVAQNTSQSGSGVIDCSGIEHELADSIVFGNGTVQLFGKCKLVGTVVGVAGTYPGGIAKDPRFLDPANGDFSLLDDPKNDDCCIDKATGTIPVDYFGNRRPRGAGNDIGAHELK